MYDHTFQNLQITRSDIRPHIKWAVSLVITYGHFNLPQRFVWVCTGSHTHFITPEGTIYRESDTKPNGGGERAALPDSMLRKLGFRLVHLLTLYYVGYGSVF